MTRKRIIKLLMGRGCDRNSAKALAEFFWIMRITYKSAWTAITREGDCPMERDFLWISSDSDGFCHRGERKEAP